MPRTISSAVSVTNAIQTCGSANHSMSFLSPCFLRSGKKKDLYPGNNALDKDLADDENRPQPGLAPY